MLREHEKKFVNDDVHWRKKIHKSPTLRMLKKPKFLVLKLTLGRVSTSRNKKNWRKFSLYSSVKFCLFQTFCNISSIFFPFNLLLVSLPTLPPNLQKNQCCLAYDVVYTLHVSLYRRALGITTMVDWRRVRDREVERNFKMFSGFQCFK